MKRPDQLVYLVLLITEVKLGVLCISSGKDFERSLFLGTRVVHGQNADIHEWPWQISLRVNEQHMCGGSLIKPNWILTAAHCVEWNPSPKIYQVVVGVHDVKGTTQKQRGHSVQQIIIHEEYHNSLFRNDIALLHLSTSVSMSTRVNVIQLPEQGDRVEVDLKCYITGWGRTSERGKPSNVLQEAELPIGQEEECQKIFPRLYHPESMICAGGKGKGGCQGDSGGPLACLEGGQWILRGVISFGKTDCSPEHYTVFARVSSLVKWIDTMIETRGSCTDKLSFCQQFAFLCESRGHSIIRKMCRKTCGLC